MEEKQKEERSIGEIINEIQNVSQDIEKLKPFAEIKQVKKFNKSGHIILPKEFVGSSVLIVKFPEINNLEKQEEKTDENKQKEHD